MEKSLGSNQGAPDEGGPRKSVEDRDDLILELVKRRYDGVLQNASALDTKAATLVGFVSVVVGLIVGGGTFDVSVIAGSILLYVPYFTSIVILLASIFFGLQAYREKRNYPIVPDVRALLSKYTRENVSYSQVLRSTAGTMDYYIEVIERSNEQKAHDINKSWYLLLIGLVSVLVLLVFFTFTEQVSQFVEALEALEVILKVSGMKLPYVQ
jgi:hypothetical protein